MSKNKTTWKFLLYIKNVFIHFWFSRILVLKTISHTLVLPHAGTLNYYSENDVVTDHKADGYQTPWYHEQTKYPSKLNNNCNQSRNSPITVINLVFQQENRPKAFDRRETLDRYRDPNEKDKNNTRKLRNPKNGDKLVSLSLGYAQKELILVH